MTEASTTEAKQQPASAFTHANDCCHSFQWNYPTAWNYLCSGDIFKCDISESSTVDLIGYRIPVVTGTSIPVSPACGSLDVLATVSIARSVTHWRKLAVRWRTKFNKLELQKVDITCGGVRKCYVVVGLLTNLEIQVGHAEYHASTTTYTPGTISNCASTVLCPASGTSVSTNYPCDNFQVATTYTDVPFWRYKLYEADALPTTGDLVFTNADLFPGGCTVHSFGCHSPFVRTADQMSVVFKSTTQNSSWASLNAPLTSSLSEEVDCGWFFQDSNPHPDFPDYHSCTSSGCYPAFPRNTASFFPLRSTGGLGTYSLACATLKSKALQEALVDCRVSPPYPCTGIPGQASCISYQKYVQVGNTLQATPSFSKTCTGYVEREIAVACPNVTIRLNAA